MIQFVREWPPGAGGIERVAHQLATQFWMRGKVSGVVALSRPGLDDLLPVRYKRVSLDSRRIGKIMIPRNCLALFKALLEQEDLLFHLPCPTLLVLSILAKAIQPRRKIFFYWHAFVENDNAFLGFAASFYQASALLLVQRMGSKVLTTSPILARSLISRGIPRRAVKILPCSISLDQERLIFRSTRFNKYSLQQGADPCLLNIVFVGRLSGYKRVDWIIEFIQQGLHAHLSVIGWGPLAQKFINQAGSAIDEGKINFHGAISEVDKLEIVAKSDVLVLPFSSKHEAFGIVQLEAMACGVPAITSNIKESGASWVAGNEQFFHFPIQEKEQLYSALKTLSGNPDLLAQLRQHAKNRYWHKFSCAEWQKKVDSIML